jgi:hypothetical protein
MENEVVENQINEEPDVKISDNITDALVFSVTYTNYINNIKNDKEDRTQGMWDIQPENFDKLKYAYVYLKGSMKMIVKKYHIEKFEYAKKEKGYDKDWKVCFVFSKSEDVFFEYPYDSSVQGRQYRSSQTMENSPRLKQGDIEVRIKQSENTPDTDYSTKVSKTGEKKSGRKRKGHILSSRDKLVSIYTEKFKHKNFKEFSKIQELEKLVDEGQEPETVLTNYFNSLKK